MTTSCFAECNQASREVGPLHPPLLTHTIGEDLDRTAARYPDRDALVECWSGRRWTYHELQADINAVALSLLAMGVSHGDRVGLWAPNCAEWVLIQYATAKIGAILTPINPAYRLPELRHVLKQSGISTVIASAEYKGTNYLELLGKVQPDCSDLKRTLIINSSDWHALLRQGRHSDPRALTRAQQACSASNPVTIQYTSGTAAAPKGATLSHHNILNNAYFVGAALAYTDRDRLCLPVPLFHCFGMVLGTLACTIRGACIVLPAPAFNAAATLQAIEQERCTAVYGVPTMFLAELSALDLDTYHLSTLRTGIMAGSPCPKTLLEEVAQRMGIPELTTSFGLTETSPTAVQCRATDPLDQRLTTAGPPLPHTEIKVADPDTGHTQPRGTPGEICIRGYLVMQGYWNDPGQTANAVDNEGWMHSGDLGTMDRHGCITITGRITDMIIRGGENISPREIEDVLRAHPDIQDVAVIGIPHPRLGEDLMAWIQPYPGADPPPPDTLRKYCANKLAHYKIPHEIRFVDALPTTATGKIRKTELRDAARTLGPCADGPRNGTTPGSGEAARNQLTPNQGTSSQSCT
ncbi:AMP-binding protein [Streptomyces sp. NPDC007205]|uniref:AMP-binding protein n=1 Tax=Streptomyces sp. NPDC007205 TaxID=3154316 RepID=UPI0033C3B9F1